MKCVVSYILLLHEEETGIREFHLKENPTYVTNLFGKICIRSGFDYLLFFFISTADKTPTDGYALPNTQALPSVAYCRVPARCSSRS